MICDTISIYYLLIYLFIYRIRWAENRPAEKIPLEKTPLGENSSGEKPSFIKSDKNNVRWSHCKNIGVYILTILWDISFSLLKSNLTSVFMKISRASNVIFIFSILYQMPFHIGMDYGQSYQVNALRTWKLKYRLKSSLFWIAIHFRPHCNHNLKANSHAKTLNSIAIVIANASLSITLNN